MMMGMGKFNQAVRKGKSVDGRIKNPVELKGAQIIGCEFCVDLGSQIARNSGFCDEELLALPRYAGATSSPTARSWRSTTQLPSCERRLRDRFGRLQRRDGLRATGPSRNQPHADPDRLENGPNSRTRDPERTRLGVRRLAAERTSASLPPASFSDRASTRSPHRTSHARTSGACRSISRHRQRTGVDAMHARTRLVHSQFGHILVTWWSHSAL